MADKSLIIFNSFQCVNKFPCAYLLTKAATHMRKGTHSEADFCFLGVGVGVGIGVGF
ncbi:MAG: hypothetical protein JXA73_11520 [Acidobacteria bacterium]|nr:hypothetical protein [Acidobacteriota bacterium]